MPEDLSRFCCQNQDCPDYGTRGIGNLTVCAGAIAPMPRISAEIARFYARASLQSR